MYEEFEAGTSRWLREIADKLDSIGHALRRNERVNPDRLKTIAADIRERVPDDSDGECPSCDGDPSCVEGGCNLCGGG